MPGGPRGWRREDAVAITVNLYSDTQSTPTPAMRRAMAEAEVGDEQRGDDPTVNRLQEIVADLLGKEAGLFLPSGTMCNEIALLVHCRQGDEIIAERTAHVVMAEGGAPALLAGVMTRTVQGEGGIFTAEQVAAAIRPASRYSPRSRLVCIEQTVNYGGGTIWPLESIRAVCDLAHQRGLSTHMDGARLMNAVVASGIAARDYCATLDSAWLDMTKGLGAPIGAVLCGTRDFIADAWRYKQMLGGAMRQAGIVAAAGIYALEHNVERLAEDHANARRLAEGLAALPGISLNLEHVQSNIVFFDVSGTGLSAAEFSAAMEARGVRLSGGVVDGRALLRAVTYIGIDAAAIDTALAAARAVLAAR
jgi:threonine aldolase